MTAESTAGAATPWCRGTLLGQISEQMGRRFLGLGTERRLASGTPLLREGDRGSHMILLRGGVTKVTSTATNGRQALLSIRVAGDLIGEMSAINGAPRTATVTTCGSTAVTIIHERQWRPFLQQFPEVALAIAGNMATRFHWANRRRLEFAAFPAKIRMARVLVELSQLHGVEVPGGRTVGVALTQPELASLCGAAEPTVEKSLRELRLAGLVDTRYRNIILQDIRQLQRVAEPDQ